MDATIDNVPTAKKENTEVLEENVKVVECSKKTCAVDQSFIKYETETFDGDSVSLQMNSKNGTKDGTEMSGGSVSDVKIEIGELPENSCTLCLQVFSRSDSLSRHMMRKHPSHYDKTKSRKRPTTDEHAYSQESPKRIRNKWTVQQVEVTKGKKMMVVLSDKMPSLKEIYIDGVEQERNKSLPASTKEADAVLQSLKDSCKKLQELGRHVLVISVDTAHSDWFGSDYGLEFVKDHAEVISSFFNYCKGKNEVVKKSIENKNTCKDLKFRMDGKIGEDYLNDKKNSNEVNMVCEDDDVEGEEDDVVDNDEFSYDDNDKEHDSKQIPEPDKQYLESKEILFRELAVGLHEVEESRDVSSLLKGTVQPGRAKPLYFTVEDLNRGQYKCSACGYNFSWKCHLELHQIKNPYCNQGNSSKITEKDILKESITFENSETGVEITSTFQELLDSQTVHPLTCAICRKSQFHNRFHLSRHLITHNAANIFECNICCAKYNKKGQLSTHLKEHFRKPFECQRCQWRFSNSLKLDCHIENGCRSISLINNKEKDSSFLTVEYKCDICSAEVIGIGALREHLIGEHNKEFGKFDCVLCDQKFLDTKLYNQHLLTHDKKYSCPFCLKQFSTKSDAYYHHVKSHKQTEEFPFVCDICGEQFKKKRYLDPHLRIHTGERPYLCDEETSPVHKQKKCRTYSPKALLDACRAVTEKGVAIKRAAEQFGVPMQTLRNRVIGNVDPITFRRGREVYFDHEEELTLVDHVETLAELGYGYSNAHLQRAAGELAFYLGKKSTSKALSNNWLYRFLERWDDRFSSIRHLKLDSNNEQSTDPASVKKYFDNLKAIFDKYNLHNKPQNVYNIDETRLQPDPNVIALTNKSQASTSSGSTTTTTTLVGCANAAGNSLPPYFIFKGNKFKPDFTKCATAGAGHDMSNNGLFKDRTFRKYLEDHFLPNIEGQLSDDNPALVIYDGHACNVSVPLIKWATENNILISVLPAHTTQILQPLYLGIFGPFKSFYYTESAVYKHTHMGKITTEFDMCELACEAYTKTMEPMNIISGFKKTGIFPFAPEEVEYLEEVTVHYDM